MGIARVVLVLVSVLAFACLGMSSYAVSVSDNGPCISIASTMLEPDTLDLVVDDVYWIDLYGAIQTSSPSITSGQPYSVCALVANTGAYDVPSFHVSLLIDDVSVGDDLIAPGIPAYGTYVLTWPGVVTSETGPHSASVAVDSLGEVTEYNLDGTAEANNVLAEPYDIRLAKWTFSVYMDSDNNLEAYGIADFLEMSSVGTSQDVNIVVQTDRIPGYSQDYGDWTGAARFLITEGMTPLEENAYENLGEVNMADGTTLQDFATHSFTTFEAENTCLVLWDHGASWIGGCCRDETSLNDSLTTDEMRTTMLAVRDSIGELIDIIGFDCCLMGSLEICYLFRDIGVNFVGSEAAIPLEGWPYDDVLRALDEDVDMTPEVLSTVMVAEYSLSYEDTPWFVTLGAFRIDEVSTRVAAAIDKLAEALMSSEVKSTWSRTAAARGASMDFDPILTDPSYKVCLHADIYSFASEVAKRISDQTILDAATDLMTAVDEAKIASSVHATYVPYYDAYGLMVFWPEQDLFLEEYAVQEISLDTAWDDFLNAYYQRA